MMTMIIMVTIFIIVFILFNVLGIFISLHPGDGHDDHDNHGDYGDHVDLGLCTCSAYDNHVHHGRHDYKQ